MPLPETLWTQGWFRERGRLPTDAIRRLAARLAHLMARGAPPTALLTDKAAQGPLWQAIAEATVAVSGALGDRPAVLPNLWVHWIDGGRRGRRGGWLPHTDRSGRTVFGPPTDPIFASLSLWLPLTPATAHNGAMRIVPSGPGPCRTTGGGTPTETLVLPAEPGDLLGWRQDLTHWGGRYDPVRARGPRAALAVEVQSRSFAAFESPLLDPTAPPPPCRLKPLVARTARRYAAFDRAADRALR